MNTSRSALSAALPVKRAVAARMMRANPKHALAAASDCSHCAIGFGSVSLGTECRLDHVMRPSSLRHDDIRLQDRQLARNELAAVLEQYPRSLPVLRVVLATFRTIDEREVAVDSRYRQRRDELFE